MAGSGPDIFLQRCLTLARLGGTRVCPNPQVGAVLVVDNEIIGEGFHPYAGGPHAEVVAVGKVKNPALLKNSTLYVSLEPCSFFGKTPACTDLIIRNQIPRVVAGCPDPNPKVSGEGIRLLREHGVDASFVADSKPFVQLIRTFYVNQQLGRPFITLKWAETADRFIAGGNAESGYFPVPITGEAANRRVHRLRAGHQAILIGRNTAFIDNPQLNLRHFPGDDPLRLVFDRSLSLPSNLRILTDGKPTLVLNEIESSHNGALIRFQPEGGLGPDKLAATLRALYSIHGICSILVEGGAALLNSFLSQDLFDECIVFRSPDQIGSGLPAPELPGNMAFQAGSFIGKDLSFQQEFPRFQSL